jgi:acyl transferase domain-containing protein
VKKTAVVVCPGRGAYNKSELGYFGRYHAGRTAFLAVLDTYRRERGQKTISDLDGADRFTVAEYTRGDNASPLIFACAYADFLSIDRNSYEIVAVTGNSMGWYIALACAGALSPDGGMDVVNTMGTLMQERMIGGQIVYPYVDANWQVIPEKRAELLARIDRIHACEGNDLHLSIDLGGMLVLAGNEAGLAAIESELEPVDGRFPLRLANHAAFHTPLQEAVAEAGSARLPTSLFGQPRFPCVDGRGHIWFPHACDVRKFHDYTLGHQVVKPYDFALAVRVALREFAPDCVIVTGPGNTLGASVAQTMISIGWRGIQSREAFMKLQESDPVLLSMGLQEQRALAV